MSLPHAPAEKGGGLPGLPCLRHYHSTHRHMQQATKPADRPPPRNVVANPFVSPQRCRQLTFLDSMSVSIPRRLSRHLFFARAVTAAGVFLIGGQFLTITHQHQRRRSMTVPRPTDTARPILSLHDHCDKSPRAYAPPHSSPSNSLASCVRTPQLLPVPSAPA